MAGFKDVFRMLWAWYSRTTVTNYIFETQELLVNLEDIHELMYSASTIHEACPVSVTDMEVAR